MECNYDHTVEDRDKLSQKLEMAREMLQIQGQDGNWDSSPYMTGLYNGMEIVIALFEERTPVYKNSMSVHIKENDQ